MELTKEQKARLADEIGHQIEGLFKTSPLYDFIRLGVYLDSRSTVMYAGKTFGEGMFVAEWHISDLKEAANGYITHVVVEDVRHDNTSEKYDGFVFDYTTKSGKLSFPLQTILKHG